MKINVVTLFASAMALAAPAQALTVEISPLNETLIAPESLTVSIDQSSTQSVSITLEAELGVTVDEPEMAMPLPVAPPVDATGANPELSITFPAAAPLPSESNALTSGEVLRLFDINFDYDKSELKEEARPGLADIANTMINNPELRIQISGHTDNWGKPLYNQQLSERRAQAVKNALTRWYGIAPERMSIAALGESAPLESNATPEGRQRNRRVEVQRIE